MSPLCSAGASHSPWRGAERVRRRAGPGQGENRLRRTQARSTNSSADKVATDTSVDRNTAEATVDWQAP